MWSSLQYGGVLSVILVAGVCWAAGIEYSPPPLIQWPAGCDQYNETAGRWPNFRWTYQAAPRTVDECRSACTEDHECGGFTLHENAAGDSVCQLRNVNDQLIRDHFGDEWYDMDAEWSWHSKTCQYDVGARNRAACNSYRDSQLQNLYTTSHRLTSNVFNVHNLSAEECHAFCTLYAGCRSVAYQAFNSFDSGGCSLHNITLAELRRSSPELVQEETGTFSTWTTYDRFCPDGAAYEPAEMLTDASARTAISVSVVMMILVVQLLLLH